ncbi:signal peptide peptidase SppA [Pontibacter sp. G13]|uniref:signal peptide peptidase SppA n=1 Tax=Pontibacter sp. G13 TaxID=3074898 RepID=UPI002889DEA5|nr:signal peptide peptidase SppA [Pontibacter sp. G13]WNJ18103.1 signal peptide peptidase SppA [Pontibacter sp. G13]
MNFLRNFFASFLAVIAALVIGLPILMGIVIGIFASIGESQDRVEVKPNTVLTLNLSGPIVEKGSDYPYSFDINPFSGNVAKKTGLFELTRKIDQAQKDDNIKGIYLKLEGGVGTGWANLSTIREKLVDFKASGKFIYAYAEIYDERSYYLASTADKVFMPKVGMLEFNGLESVPMFYADMFKKIGVKPEIFRVGTFKSAVEPFLRTDMSEPSKQQTRALLSDVWDVFLSDISASRGIPKDQLDHIAANFMIGNAAEALKAGLIDEVAYEHTVLDALKEATGKESDEKLTTLSMKKFMKVPGTYNSSRNKIAVVFAEGGINSGKSTEGSIGSETIVKALRKAREDDNVKAVVLRINSPGGSALASDMIAEEVRLTGLEKPIVASMGNVAASGGYYIAAKCDKIFAQENTITGSIGIFSILFDAQNLMNQKIGLTFDAVETHEHANLYNPGMPMSPAVKKFFQANVEKGYGTFIEVVREGRGFADSLAVDKVGQGRVWSGRAAQGIELVDEYGNLETAISYVAEEAGLGDDFKIKTLPEEKDPFEALLNDMVGSAKQSISEEHPLYQELQTIKEIKQTLPGSGTYMLMPYQFEIR